jgi:hypothetical protein
MATVIINSISVKPRAHDVLAAVVTLEAAKFMTLLIPSIVCQPHWLRQYVTGSLLKRRIGVRDTSRKLPRRSSGRRTRALKE